MVERRYAQMPPSLAAALLPFQQEGVRKSPTSCQGHQQQACPHSRGQIASVESNRSPTTFTLC